MVQWVDRVLVGCIVGEVGRGVEENIIREHLCILQTRKGGLFVN